jgi:hypothetical protein
MPTQDNTIATANLVSIRETPERVEFDDLPLDYIIDLLAAEQAAFKPNRETDRLPANGDRPQRTAGFKGIE